MPSGNPFFGPAMKITAARVIVTCPGRNFVTLKIETDQGVYGIGDATLNGRELAVVSYLQDHRLGVLVIRPKLSESVVPIWPSHHRTHDRAGDRLSAVPPFPPSLTVVPPPVLWNRCATVVHVLGIVSAITHQIAHFLRILPQNIVDLCNPKKKKKRSKRPARGSERGR